MLRPDMRDLHSFPLPAGHKATPGLLLKTSKGMEAGDSSELMAVATRASLHIPLMTE